MARNRRKASTKKEPATTPAEEENVEGSSPSHKDKENNEDVRSSVAKVEEDKCPGCPNSDVEQVEETNEREEKESWIRCDACKVWFHWRCTGRTEEAPEAIDKWFCKPCLDADKSRIITLKPPTRKSQRKRPQPDYTSLNSGSIRGGPGSGGDPTDANKWTRILETRPIKQDSFPRMKGADVGIEWLESNESAMREPIVIEEPEGLGMKMPPEDFSVADVGELVGEDVALEVMDVSTQSTAPGWTLGKWVEYFNTPSPSREKILNVISLEISGTKLADKILPPRLVRQIDWVEKFWPSSKKGKGHSYPKVQLYCLMGVAGAWTDWHIDFAGSSVYYHILRGSKVFYFIKPTPANLAAYERWSGTEMQTHTWLGDLVDEVVKVELKTGNTMIIPTGWIHAVATPVDTLVFGGNFLHSYNVGTQLKIRKIEIATQVPKKFRFPHFTRLCWYVAEKYLRDVKAKEEFPKRILDSVEQLANFLIAEIRKMERGTEQAKKEAKEQIPSERVKDAPALARELRWRVRLAAGQSSDNEDTGLALGVTGKPGPANNSSNKRKRVETGPASSNAQRPLFKNFQPKLWDHTSSFEETKDTNTLRLPRLTEAGGVDGWIEWETEFMDADDGEVVDVVSRREIITKVRRTKQGLERMRVERVIEKWSWAEGAERGEKSGTEDDGPKEGDNMEVIEAAGT